jgi:hypothetical protein
MDVSITVAYIIAGIIGLALSITLFYAVIRIWLLLEEIVNSGAFPTIQQSRAKRKVQKQTENKDNVAKNLLPFGGLYNDNEIVYQQHTFCPYCNRPVVAHTVNNVIDSYWCNNCYKLLQPNDTYNDN